MPSQRWAYPPAVDGEAGATLSTRAPVAQLDRASVYGTEGHRFESCRARHSTSSYAGGSARTTQVVRTTSPKIILDGGSSDRAARRLVVAEATVKTHVRTKPGWCGRPNAERLLEKPGF